MPDDVESPDWLSRIDPELTGVLPFLPEGDLSDPASARAALEALVGGMAIEIPGIETLGITDHTVPGVAGAPEVTLRCYRPRTPAPQGGRPGLLWIHGGGFVLGSVEMDHGQSAALAIALDAVVVSPEYRLAPEHPYPAALDDCMAALRWLSDGAAAHDVDPTRVAVGGVSAGGGLSAAVALRARDENGPPLCFQLLAIPELDDRLETPSMREFVDTPMWNRQLAELSWRYYLGEAAGGDVPPHAAPARATDLSDLPPAYVATSELDPLRDEGILYAMALMAAGVAVELHHFPGTYHGSALVYTADVSIRSTREIRDALRRGLGIGD